LVSTDNFSFDLFYEGIFKKESKITWWQKKIERLTALALRKQNKISIAYSSKQIDQALVTFSVSIVNDQRIRKLNLDYRRIDQATDVLSFSSFESISESLLKEILKNKISLELGDIFISEERLVSQAREYEHSFEREASFLFTHGFLHLLGFDHQTKEQEQKMFDLQKDILENK